MRRMRKRERTVRRISITAISIVAASTSAFAQAELASPATPSDRHDEGIRDKLRYHGGAHRQVRPSAGEQANDGGHVEPSFWGPDIGEDRHPFLVGPVGRELAIQHIAGDDGSHAPIFSSSRDLCDGARASKAWTPLRETPPMSLGRPAYPCHRPAPSVLRDKTELHIESLAK